MRISEQGLKQDEDRPTKSLDKRTPARQAVGHQGHYNSGKLQNRALLKAGDVNLTFDVFAHAFLCTPDSVRFP